MAELFVSEDNETLEGTEENDILDATGFTGTTLNGLAGDDELLAGTDGILNGGADDDILDATAGGGGNTLDGETGNDTLFGNSNDTLNGGDGTDRLFTTGTGGNTYTGGSGSDQFWLAQAELPATANTVTDFTQGEDVLGIAGLDGIAEGFEDIDIEQTDSNTTISVAEGTTLATLQGFSEELTAEDFVFGAPQQPSPDQPVVELSIDPASGSEQEETTFTLTATASAAVTGEQTVDLGLSGVNPEDFTGEFPTSISIADGETTGSVEVTVNDDQFVEGNETATFAISNPSDGIALGDTVEVSSAIADNEPEVTPDPVEFRSFFDQEFYLNNNPDVANAVETGDFDNAFEHFSAFGLDEARDPSEALTLFTGEAYLENNPDVDNAVETGIFDNGLEHFLRFGVNEGRSGTGYQFFDPQDYLGANPDVAAAVEQGDFQTGLEHFLRFGFEENRSGVEIPDQGEANQVVA